MIGDTYPFLAQGYNAHNDQTFFIFISRGKTSIRKLVVFEPIFVDGHQYYNWGLGDIKKRNNTTLVDDFAVSNNGDAKMVFYTVISTLSIFFARYPTATVHLQGSNRQRNTIYRNLFHRHWEQIGPLYNVTGVVDGQIRQFDHATEFKYLLISRKNNRH